MGKRLRDSDSKGRIGKYIGERKGIGMVIKEWEEEMAERPVKEKGKVGAGGLGVFEGW